MARPTRFLQPSPVNHVENEKFKIVGEDGEYKDIVSALEASRKRGIGSEVIRLSDGKTVGTVPGHIPPPPKEWR